MCIARVNGVAPIHAAAIHIHLGAVGERVLDRVRIEILIHVWFIFRIGLVMPPTYALSFDRPRVLHPAQMIDVMNVEITEATAAGPEKTMKILNLPEQFTRLPRPLCGKS